MILYAIILKRWNHDIEDTADFIFKKEKEIPMDNPGRFSYRSWRCI